MVDTNTGGHGSLTLKPGSREQDPPLRNHASDPLPPKRSIIYKIPAEILLEITQLVTPLHQHRTKKDLFNLFSLTHICRFWRAALINQPRIWSTIFVTYSKRRSFVEACLERSHSTPLDIKMEVYDGMKAHTGCSCDGDHRGRLFPNEVTPCEWHFQFECLAQLKHTRRIRTLSIHFHAWADMEWTKELALGSCRFFTSSFPELAALEWVNRGMEDINYLFSTPPFPPSLRSLAFTGIWNDTIAPVNNLTSFFFKSSNNSNTDVGALRLFMLNNQSLESLQFDYSQFEGVPKGPPVDLLNLKSLSVGTTCWELMTIIRVPALGRLSSLQITTHGGDAYKLRATGDGITFFAISFYDEVAVTWDTFTRCEKPTLRHVRLDGWLTYGCLGDPEFASILVDAHTLEIGSDYYPSWYDGFREDLEQHAPQLKVIRFAISGQFGPYGHGEEAGREILLGQIEDLVRYRFEHGRPFSAVERMSFRRHNEVLDYLWRCFYDRRKLGQYLRPT